MSDQQPGLPFFDVFFIPHEISADIARRLRWVLTGAVASLHSGHSRWLSGSWSSGTPLDFLETFERMGDYVLPIALAQLLRR